MSTPTDATRSPPGLATDTGLSQLHLRRPPEGIGGFDLGTRSDSLVATPGGSSRGGCIKRPISSLDEAGSDPRDVIERDQALNHSDQDGPGTDMRAGEGIALQSVTPETSTCSGTNSAPWVFTRNSRTWPELPTAVSPTQSHSTPESFHSAADDFPPLRRVRTEGWRMHKDSRADTLRSIAASDSASLRERAYTFFADSERTNIGPAGGPLRRASTMDPVPDATISRITGAPITTAPVTTALVTTIHGSRHTAVASALRAWEAYESRRWSRGRGNVPEYTSPYGANQRSHPLCLECFRDRRSFNVIVGGYCELCDGEEVLGSHYWDRSDSEQEDV